MCGCKCYGCESVDVDECVMVRMVVQCNVWCCAAVGVCGMFNFFFIFVSGMWCYGMVSCEKEGKGCDSSNAFCCGCCFLILV